MRAGVTGFSSRAQQAEYVETVLWFRRVPSSRQEMCRQFIDSRTGATSYADRMRVPVPPADPVRKRVTFMAHDLANQTPRGGYAADNQASAPRVFVPGTEPAIVHPANQDIVTSNLAVPEPYGP